jgi:oligosaccharyltransferase complex subunit epsilon
MATKLLKKQQFLLTFATILTSKPNFQVNPANKDQFGGISPERGFADFIFSHIILHLVVVNFIG